MKQKFHSKNLCGAPSKPQGKKKKKKITLCLLVVCLKNTFPTYSLKIGTLPSEVSSICLPLPISAKNKGKFVFLLLFYISLLLKYKKLNYQGKKKI